MSGTDSTSLRSALVTGPTSGIGAAFARSLAASGHDLVLVARDRHRLERTAADLTDRYGVQCAVLAADLCDAEQTLQVERRLRDHPVDLLVNNAGFSVTAAFPASDIEEEQRSFDVLVRAPMRLTHAALGPMLERGSGEIINVSSVAGFLPRGTYSAHKAWVTSFSRWLNLRYRPAGVTVMALCAGFVRTEFHQRMNASTAGIPGWMWLDADALVADAMRDLAAGKAVSIPSRRYQALTVAAKVLPGRLVERVARVGR